MDDSISVRRLVENEVVFRQANQKVVQDLHNFKQAAMLDGSQPVLDDEELSLHFYCECSDEDCRERIVIPMSTYKSIHKNNSYFTVLPNHHIPDIETVVSKSNDYFVVKKRTAVPRTVTKLHHTNINNT